MFHCGRGGFPECFGRLDPAQAPSERHSAQWDSDGVFVEMSTDPNPSFRARLQSAPLGTLRARGLAPVRKAPRVNFWMLLCAPV